MDLRGERPSKGLLIQRADQSWDVRARAVQDGRDSTQLLFGPVDGGAHRFRVGYIRGEIAAIQPGRADALKIGGEFRVRRGL